MKKYSKLSHGESVQFSVVPYGKFIKVKDTVEPFFPNNQNTRLVLSGELVETKRLTEIPPISIPGAHTFCFIDKLGAEMRLIK